MLQDVIRRNVWSVPSGRGFRSCNERSLLKYIRSLAGEPPLLGFRGLVQPSPMLGRALSAGFRYLEVRCAGSGLHSTIDLNRARNNEDDKEKVIRR